MNERVLKARVAELKAIDAAQLGPALEVSKGQVFMLPLTGFEAVQVVNGLIFLEATARERGEAQVLNDARAMQRKVMEFGLPREVKEMLLNNRRVMHLEELL